MGRRATVEACGGRGNFTKKFGVAVACEHLKLLGFGVECVGCKPVTFVVPHRGVYQASETTRIEGGIPEEWRFDHLLLLSLLSRSSSVWCLSFTWLCVMPRVWFVFLVLSNRPASSFEELRRTGTYGPT